MKITMFFVFVTALLVALPVMAAYQYNTKGNQGWLTFDSDTTVAFDLGTSGKDKDHENFIDRGEGVVDYGWFNMDTGAVGSFKDGASGAFTENDRIALWVQDNKGNVYLSTKPDENSPANSIWGKSRLVDGNIAVAGGNFGSNGTHEYYVFKISTVNANGQAPSGQPLPGIIATLIVGGGTLIYLKKRKALYKEK